MNFSIQSIQKTCDFILQKVIIVIQQENITSMSILKNIVKKETEEIVYMVTPVNYIFQTTIIKNIVLYITVCMGEK